MTDHLPPAGEAAPRATCPSCGHPVRVVESLYLGDLKAYHYEPIEPAPDPLTALERAVVEAATEEIHRRWENLGYFIRTPPGQRVKLKAHKMAVATASMALSEAVENLTVARFNARAAGQEGGKG